MTDEELIARLREIQGQAGLFASEAADRIEALRARIDTMIGADTVQTMLDNAQPIMAEACAGYEAQIEALTAQVERLTGAATKAERIIANGQPDKIADAGAILRAALSITEEGK